jgi:hypothetical protein
VRCKAWLGKSGLIVAGTIKLASTEGNLPISFGYAARGNRSRMRFGSGVECLRENMRLFGL